jgi:hypothetical protein
MAIDRPPPRRLLLQQRLTEFYESEISEANGYNHTLKGNVFRGRLRFDSKDPLPAIAILDNMDPDRFPQYAGRHGAYMPTAEEEYVLLLQGWALDDACHPTDPAHYLMADVRKATAILQRRPFANPFAQSASPDGRDNPNYLLGGLLTGLAMEPGVVRPPMEGVSEKAFFFFRLRLKLVENPEDPYDTGAL